MYGHVILSAASGLGLFLYGMHLMGDGLQKAAGEKLKSIIGLLTTNKYIAVIVGTLVTAIIQSSSATTVMVIGFVNAGLMTLNQAIGIIMGANIGTTMTAQLVSFNLEAVAPISVAIGMLIYVASKNQKSKNYAEILIGFGILFVGMVYMKDAVKPLRDIKAFQDMLISFGKNPFLGILVGFFLTLLLQSSSASIGILVALAMEGALPLSSALPILYGDNIGTCTTALLSSIGASKNAQRAAVMHLTFNVIGTLIFVLFLNAPVTYVVTQINPLSVSRQIANAHTLFNLTNVVIQLPFSALIVKFATWIIPDGKVAEKGETSITKLDKRMLSTPSIALENAYNECLNMGQVAFSSLEKSVNGFLSKNQSELNETLKLEKNINRMEREIIDYLVAISQENISSQDRLLVDSLFNTINDIERIGDHAENIAELGTAYTASELNFSKESRVELAVMVEKVFKSVKVALDAMKTKDKKLATVVFEMEGQVDELEKANRMAHINRLNHGLCNTEAGILFLDLISNLERISDHAVNIAEAVLGVTE